MNAPTTLEWHDAFGRKLVVGSRVTYPRSQPNGGGYKYVVGIITGPARLSGDYCVSVKLTEASVELLAQNMPSHRKRPINAVVPSVCMVSLIAVDDSVDALEKFAGVR